jgi:hypothetical protein
VLSPMSCTPTIAAKRHQYLGKCCQRLLACGKIILCVCPSISPHYLTRLTLAKECQVILSCKVVKPIEGLSVDKILFNSSTIRSPDMILIRSAFFEIDCNDSSSISKFSWLQNEWLSSSVRGRQKSNVRVKRCS